MLSSIEKGCFVSLFNRGGYVLNFSTADFDAFTAQSCGVPLCSRYRLSKGRSLAAYVVEAPSPDAQKLLFDLLEYYESYYRDEFTEDVNADSYSASRYNSGFAALYNRCKEYRNRELSLSTPVDCQVEYIKSKFTSEYMHNQIDLLLQMRNDNPTEAIGKSKELVESCCKTILEYYGIAHEKAWSVQRLAKETAKVLDIDAGNVVGSNNESEIVKKILGNLQGLVGGLAEFRNAYGSGHGKGDSFVALPVRHAKLATGCAITLVEYFWETFEWRTGKAQ